MRLAVRRALVGLSVCGALLSSSAAVPATADPLPVRSYAYGSHARQTVTVYGTRGPALVILHGGYWAHDADWSRWARWFAGQGFRVYDADYRLNSDARWPAQRVDAVAVLKWVAARHGGRTPLLLGSSAGGQIATVAGAWGAGRDRVRGVVALSPVATPYRAWVDGARAGASQERRKLRREARRLAGCSPDDGDQGCWARWGDMAASSHASGPLDAPLFLVHSSGDFVPPAHSRDLSSAARTAGLRDVTLRVVPGAAHGAGLLEAPGVQPAVVKWLRSHA